ncbi:hypothetical protein ACSLPB_29160, partial [Escherichia coli]|uniref:hypothetical protein n=1 Tax=Escherichia coli TaxID=562 RepID=UPI003EDF3D4A
KSIVKKTDINKVPFVSRVFWFSVIRNICLPERKTNLINQNGIGGQTTAGLRHLFGHVRNFRLWHKELTDAQLGEVVE